MQPLIEDKISYQKHKVGVGKNAIARLFNDHLEIVDSAGTQLANVSLKEITKVRHVKGQIEVYVGNQMHGLMFLDFKYRMLGLLGVWLSHCIQKAKNWEANLTQLGIKVDKKLF